MKNDVEYRIREYCGTFEIQIRGYEEKGMLWWKRKEWSWYRTNAWGGVIQTFPILQPFSKRFKTQLHEQIYPTEQLLYHHIYNICVYRIPDIPKVSVLSFNLIRNIDPASVFFKSLIINKRWESTRSLTPRIAV